MGWTRLSSTPPFLDGLAALADGHDAFILDQWGVLHNGTRPYPGVFEVLEALAARDKPVVLLTNSGRRADFNRGQLKELGFDPDHFAGIVTSGEATFDALKRRDRPPFDRLGRRCLLFTRTGDEAVFAELALEVVDRPEKAEFILMTWVEPDHRPLFERLMAEGPAAGLPMVCANPDRVAVGAAGLHEAPGTLAHRYAEAGGEVLFVGKPHRPIYERCLDLLGGLDPGRILAVGDSMEHDIKGANGVGLPSAFVSQGIHAELFDPALPAETRRRNLDRLAAENGARPDYVIPRLIW